MALLDRFIEALIHTPGAQSMKLISGVPTELVVAGASRTISKNVPTAEQILAALAEILPETFLEQIRYTPQEASYQSPYGPVTIRARAAVDKCSVWIVPAELAAQAQAHVQAQVAAQVAAHPGLTATPRVELHETVGHIDELFNAMLDRRASDLHLKSGTAPYVRIDGEMAVLPGFPVLAPEKLSALVEAIIPERNRAEYRELKDTDFAYTIEGRARMRCNVFEDIEGMGAVFRQIPSRVLSAKELGLPQSVIQLCDRPKGLVLVTGPTGSGKSTTLAAMIDHINATTTNHIITIEDPVEFVHASKGCLINQREVGSNTRSFKNALRAALREDPDVVLVGELRDLETTAIAIETAETGHLVFGTMHTTTAPSTVDRIVNQFPAERQAPIRMMLSESLIGVVSQMLCKRRGGGRVAALEILIVTPAVANLIREEKTFQIVSIMQTSKALGMQTLNEALLGLAKAQLIEPDEAYAQAVQKKEMSLMLGRSGFKGVFSEEGA